MAILHLYMYVRLKKNSLILYSYKYLCARAIAMPYAIRYFYSNNNKTYVNVKRTMDLKKSE